MDRETRRNRYVETGEAFVNTLRLKHFHTILDLGCGENLYSDVDGVIGVDLISPHANVIADISNLPFEDASIDCVLVFGSLVFGSIEDFNHIEPNDLLASQLKEISRVMKSDGLLYGRTQYQNISMKPTLISSHTNTSLII